MTHYEITDFDNPSATVKADSSEFNSITIMKYKYNNEYSFKIMDRFDIADETERLDAMILIGNTIRDKGGEVLWIKNSVII